MQWPTLPWGPFVMTGPSIGHPYLTIGFLGFGRISQETLRRLLVFTSQSAPPTVTYVSSRARPNQAEIDAEFSKKYGVTVKRQEKEEVAAQADILIVLCVQNESTINLVNKDFLKKMKKSAVLVNAARVSHATVIEIETGVGYRALTAGPNCQLRRLGVGVGRRGDLRSWIGRDHGRAERVRRSPAG